jgi:hypothetical protein
VTIMENLRTHPIRAFALLCVAATSAFLGYLAIRLIDTLSSPTWCSTALQAERITAKDSFVGLTACVELLKIQLTALALNSQIVIGTFALCLGVLVVIVIAGARLAGKGPGGVEFDVSTDPAAKAADEVAGAAVEKADQIKGETI